MADVIMVARLFDGTEVPIAERRYFTTVDGAMRLSGVITTDGAFIREEFILSLSPRSAEMQRRQRGADFVFTCPNCQRGGIGWATADDLTAHIRSAHPNFHAPQAEAAFQQRHFDALRSGAR